MPGAEQRQEHNQPQRYKPVEFGEYNGWPNRPTWSVYTIFTGSDFETYDMLRNKASRPTGAIGEVRRAVIGTVQHWKVGKRAPHTGTAKLLVKDFLMHGVRTIAWTPVYDTLRGERAEIGEVNSLTGQAFELLAQTDWQAIVQDAKDLTGADTALRDWLEARLLTWADYLEARERPGNISTFANTISDMYLQAVDWQKVTNALRET